MMVLPPEALPPRIAAVVWAVTTGARSFREVSERCGWASPSAPLGPMREARAQGLVDFEDNKDGTMRSNLEIVAFTPPSKLSNERAWYQDHDQTT